MTEPQGEQDKRTTAAIPLLKQAVETHGENILQNPDFKAAIIAAFSGKSDKTKDNLTRIAEKLSGSMKLSDYLDRETIVDRATNNLVGLIEKHTTDQGVDYISLWRDINEKGLFGQLDEVQQSYFRRMGSEQLQKQTNERPVLDKRQVQDAPPIS